LGEYLFDKGIVFFEKCNAFFIFTAWIKIVLKMKKFLIVVVLLFLAVSLVSAQKRKKNRMDEPTPTQIENFKIYYKKMLGDSVNIPLVKRDTVATIEIAAMLKKRKINGDKSIAKDDKDVQNGMIDDDMYMQLGAILTIDELQRLRDFEQRQKAAQAAREKEIKDAQNQQGAGSSYRPYGGY